MTVHRLVVAGRARLALLRIGAWWRANRSAAPELFQVELSQAFDLIANMPSSGELWTSARRPGIRRWLLPKTRYHVYYSVDDASTTVTVRMLWYAGRGRAPIL